MTRLEVLGTGGTIVSNDAGSGAIASGSIEDLVERTGLDCEVSARDVMTTGSYRLGLTDLRTIAEAIGRATADPEVDGVVVTHGTDTMEETAFLADLIGDQPTPVVFTGAQRSPDELDTDGPRNLRDSLLVAADPASAGWGAVICFDGRVRAARGTSKRHTLASDPFEGGVVLGEVVRGTLRADAAPVRRPHLPAPTDRFDDVAVEIFPAFAGSDPAHLDRAVDAGADAVVLAGTGTGNAGPGYTEAVNRAVRAGVPVVLCSRVGAGPVVPVYGNGGGVDLVAAGAVVSGNLGPYQARILAALLVSHGVTGERFAGEFTRYV